MKKAQAAMEFLMTYGWAILVVLAAIGALAYFGVLSPDRFMPSKCMVSGGFSCIEYKMDASVPEVRFYLQNNLGVDTEIGSVNVYLNDTSGDGCTGVGNTALTLTNGQKSDALNFTGCSISGSSFRGNILITYVKAGESESHTASGSISGRFES